MRGHIEGGDDVARTEVQEEPLVLVNADEEELRDLFGECLGEVEEIEEAIEFVDAWRALFELATRAPRDLVAEARIVKGKLRPRWAGLAPWVQHVPQMDPIGDGQLFMGLELRTEQSPVWWCLEDGSANTRIRLSAGRQRVVWERLWEAYQAGRVFRCETCGRLAARAAVARRDQAYCSDACRQAAWRARKKLGHEA